MGIFSGLPWMKRSEWNMNEDVMVSNFFLPFPPWGYKHKFTYNKNLKNTFVLDKVVLWSPRSGNAKQAQLVLKFPDVESYISPKLQRSILSSKSQSTAITWEKLKIFWNFGFILCVGSLIPQICQKVLSVFVYVDIQARFSSF